MCRAGAACAGQAAAEDEGGPEEDEAEDAGGPEGDELARVVSVFCARNFAFVEAIKLVSNAIFLASSVTLAARPYSLTSRIGIAPPVASNVLL